MKIQEAQQISTQPWKRSDLKDTVTVRADTLKA